MFLREVGIEYTYSVASDLFGSSLCCTSCLRKMSRRSPEGKRGAGSFGSSITRPCHGAWLVWVSSDREGELVAYKMAGERTVSGL